MVTSMVSNVMNNDKKKGGDSRQESRRNSRGGAALLFSLFIIAFMTLMVVNVLDATTLELSALRNSMDYERALFLAGAGVQEMAAQLVAPDSLRTPITNGAYPADDTYEATAVTDPTNVRWVIVTSKGVAGQVERTVVATIEL